MNKKFKKIALILLTIVIVCFSSFSLADVGNFESYDSDWGSSWDSSSSWDSDWGSSSSWDNDYSYSGGSYSGGGIGIFFAIFLIIIIISFTQAAKNNNINNSNPTRTYTEPQAMPNVLNEIREVDKFFNEDKFLANAKNLFVKLQNAWTARDWEVIRTFESEELFEQHQAQIKQYIDKKQINVMDRIAVNYAKLYSFSQDNDKDTLKILLNSSMIDYVMEEETQKVVLGDKTTRRTRTYVMTFIRKKGVLTSESNGDVKTTNCPNCGAPTKITSAGKCEYCGSVITTGEHDWVLSNLEPYRG